MSAIAVAGNLTADPELRFTPSGAAVANFTVAVNERVYDKASGEWKEGDTTFWRVNAWRALAENVTNSLVRGQRVIVHGKVKSRQFETREGEKRTVFEIEAEEVGPSLKFASASPQAAAKAKPARAAVDTSDPWG